MAAPGSSNPPTPPAPQGMPGPVAPPAPQPASAAAAPPPGTASGTPSGGGAAGSPPPTAPIPTLSSTAPGCFHVDVRLNSIQYDYDPTAPGQITQDQLDLLAQLKKTESALKSIFFPDGLPDDLRLRKPSPPIAKQAHHHHTAHPPATVVSAAAVVKVKAQYAKDEEENQAELTAAQGDPKKKKAEKKKEKFRSYFYQLVLLAQLGLDGPTSSPFLARFSLASFKDQILAQEGGRIKNGYMQTLGENAIWLGAIPTACLIIREIALQSVSSQQRLLVPPVVEFIVVLLYAWVGAMVGTFLSYAMRNPVLSFDQLAVPEEDRLNPRMRLIYVGILTEILTLALLLHAISISLGTAQTGDLTKSPIVALLVGVFCGISERALGDKLLKSADAFTK